MNHSSFAARAFFIFIILAGMFLPGCEQLPTYGMVRVITAGERAYLVAQTIPLAGDKEKFMLFSSIDPERKNWTAPTQYLGKVIGAATENDSALLIFANGSISNYRYEGGAFKAERRYSGDLELIDATGVGDEILGLTFSAKSFQVQRFNNDSWLEYGPALKVPGNVYAPRLTSFRSAPCVIWLNRASLQSLKDSKARPYRIAMLVENQWQVEVLPFDNLNGVALTALALDNSLAILATEAGERSNFGSHSIASGLWDGTAIAHKGSFADGDIFNSLTGISISCCQDGEGILGAVAAENGLHVFTSAGRELIFNSPHLIFGTQDSNAVSQALIFMVFLLFAVISITLHLVLKRNRHLAITSPAIQPENLGARAGVSGRLEFIPQIGAGGIATPLDRALALMIDLALFIPLLGAFMMAQGIDFMASNYLPEEVILLALPSLTLFIFIFILYVSIAEMLTGQTLGKRMVGICVRALEGGRASPRRIALRNLFWPLDCFPVPVWFFPALISMLLSRYNQRLGDRLAGTVVTRRVPMSQRRIILASASPRRKDSLLYMGLSFEVMVPDVDETPPLRRTPEEVVMALAKRKAEQINNSLSGGEIVIAADTIIVLDDKLIGKPRDRDEAREILKKLSGSRHAVITGLAVLDRATGRQILTAERTEIQMSPMGEQEINAYVDSGEADGKAGAYAIQETGDRFAHIVAGSFSNVVGLPIERLSVILRDFEA